MNLTSFQPGRTRILAAIVLSIVAIFALRLFYIQVIQHNYYSGLADQEQLKKERVPAVRGSIYAMNGDAPVPLVMNETVYTVFADPATIEDKQGVIDVMKRVAGGNVRDGFESLLDKTDTRYQIIANKVTRLQADKIKEEGLYGIGFHAMSQRVYPEGELAAQLLGFVDTEGDGKYGIESFMDDELSGIDGRLETVTDISDIPLTIGDRNIREPAQHGKDIVLSVDRNIQAYAEEALARGLKRSGATEGSALIMDPNTGKVMAIANLPTYNPGNYSQVSDVAVFNNNAVSRPYEPGSSVKTLTMGIGMDKGVAKASDTFVNRDVVRVDGWDIGNASKGMTGTVSFQTAMQWSLNTGFVTVAQRLGDGRTINRTARDTMYTYFHDRFRLGAPTGIELANEARGVIYKPDSHEGNAVRYATMSFGQGLNVTMVQLASGFSALINGGHYYKPTVVGGFMVDGIYNGNDSPKPVQSGVVKSSTSNQMRRMMEEARSSSFGHVDRSGYKIGGKTGTSQVAKENGSGYKDNETIGSYLGYGGADKPEYVIIVAISGKGKKPEGARDAMPIFTDISNWLIDYLKIQPRG